MIGPVRITGPGTQWLCRLIETSCYILSEGRSKSWTGNQTWHTWISQHRVLRFWDVCRGTKPLQHEQSARCARNGASFDNFKQSSYVASAVANGQLTHCSPALILHWSRLQSSYPQIYEVTLPYQDWRSSLLADSPIFSAAIASCELGAGWLSYTCEIMVNPFDFPMLSPRYIPYIMITSKLNHLQQTINCNYIPMNYPSQL